MPFAEIGCPLPDLSIVLLLAGVIIVSSVISRSLPALIPPPLVQIALGYGVALFGGFEVELEPELFLFLFLPPLLFLDAWRIQKRSFYANLKAIINLSLGLVVFTVLGLGFLLNWLIPAIPLPAAFALAAILSPTDPVAISAIARTVPIPRRLMHILEGESLLNDASGLVCMRFAVAAIASGTFSLSSAAGNFAWLALSGVAIGAVLSWFVNRLNYLVTRRIGEDVSTEIVFSLLIPFAAYYLAEKAGGSGVLAVVAAGLVMSRMEIRHLGLPGTRLRRNAVWDLLQFGLNGAMFIILGEQLPHIFRKASELVGATGHAGAYWLVIYAGLVVLGLIALRFVWVWVSLTLARGHQPLRMVLVAGLSGVRGAITLAGVLSMPLVLDNGQPFPARDLIIFIAACVIILSLLMACLSMPLALRGLVEDSQPALPEQELQARMKAANVALDAIEAMRKEMSSDPAEQVAADISALYSGRLERAKALIGSPDPAETLQILQAERRIWLAALHAERIAIQSEVRAHRLTDDVGRTLLHEVDLMEERWLRAMAGRRSA